MGPSVLQEFLQNADDARAKHFALVLDLEGTATAEAALSNGELTALVEATRPPSLFVYNDASFSEADLQSISSVGASGKTSDASTIGKYRLGFNVAYHLSEVVTFASERNFVTFDPHGRSLPQGLLGLRSDFLAHRWASTQPALLAPFVRILPSLLVAETGQVGAGEGVWDGSSGLPGTLFQMPLRTPAQAETSQLSTRAYTHEEVPDMLIAFGGAANEMVLSLQSVESIEVYLKVPGEEGEHGLRRVASSRILNTTHSSIGQRSTLRLNASAERREERIMITPLIGHQHYYFDWASALLL